TEALQTLSEDAGALMNARRDFAKAPRAMIDGVHRSYHGEENLSRANVTGRFVATDVLLASLQREAVSRTALRIVRNTDEAARHVTLVSVARCKISGMRSAIAKGNAEALRAADCDISAKFCGRAENCQAQNVRGDNGERITAVNALNEIRVIIDRSIGGRILQEHAEDRFLKIEVAMVADDDLDAERFCAGAHDSDGLRVAPCRNEKGCAFELRIFYRETERHCFRGSRGFIEQRCIRDIESGQIGNHRLEIEQR